MTRPKIFLLPLFFLLAGCAGPLSSEEEPEAQSDPPIDAPSEPDVASFDAPVVEVVAGHVPSFVVLADGHVWGWTDFAQPSPVPEENAPFWLVEGPRPVRIEGLEGVVHVAFRFHHGCALHHDGTVSCWGDNASGQLGNGTRTSTRKPARVEGLEGVVEIDVGEQHSCARREGGEILCWGNRAAYWPFNPLKDGSVLDLVPFRLEGFPPASALSLSRLHTCATGADGQPFCWGNMWPGDSSKDISFDEQLTYRDFALDAAPARLLHGSCAELGDGSIACACRNEEVGVEPKKLPCHEPGQTISPFGADIVRADARVAQVCAIIADGSVRCLGQWASPYRLDPPWEYADWERIEGLSSPTAIDVGVNACVIDGACVRCWGPTIGKAPRTVGCYEAPPDGPH